MTTAVANNTRRATESGLMAMAATSNVIARVFNKVEHKSLNKAIDLRSTRKNIRKGAAAQELLDSHKATLENIDLKYAKLKGIFSPKEKQVDEVPAGKVWEPKIV